MLGTLVDVRPFGPRLYAMRGCLIGVAQGVKGPAALCLRGPPRRALPPRGPFSFLIPLYIDYSFHFAICLRLANYLILCLIIIIININN